MDRNTYIDTKKKVRASIIGENDKELLETLNKLLNFAFDNFKEKEEIYQGNDYQYEIEISDIGLSLEAFLQKKPEYKKSKLIKSFIIETINTEKYKNGRDSFIFLLYILKMDDELRRIATERKEFWEHPRLQFQLLYAIYRRNIRGFEVEAEKLMNEFKKGDIHKYSKKYLEKMNK